MAFVPYVMLAGVVGLGLLAVMRNWWALGVSAQCVVSLALMVIPRASVVLSPRRSRLIG